MKRRYDHILQILRERPYKTLVWPLSLIYALFVVIVYIYMYNGHPLDFFTSFPRWYTITATTFHVIITLLTGVAITLFIAKIHELRLKSAGVGITGLLFAALAAGCPGCFFGLFPIVMSFFGITATLAILPFNGLELQVVTICMLLLSVFFLAKETEVACELPKK